jgi:hypothetical protein|nr:MAG TPA: hypothetical protein [Bacteriophage sp.]
MKRPNRYPYTRSQWEEVTLVCFDGNISLKLREKRNRITREVKNELQNNSKR